MSFNLQVAARGCYERLVRDFHEVKKVIDGGDMEEAHTQWGCSMLDSQHSIYEPYISQVAFRGETFSTCAQGLLGSLEERNTKRVDFYVKELTTVIRQEEMRKKALERNPELIRNI